MWAPPQGVDDAGAGQAEGVPDESVLAGAAPGAHCGESGGGCGRKANLEGLAFHPGQHRCVVRVGLQQFGAQTVDEQDARPRDIAWERNPAVETCYTHRGQHRRHHVGQVR
jgi:hypothetical protein